MAWIDPLFNCFSADPCGSVEHAIQRYMAEFGQRPDRVTMNASEYLMFRRGLAWELKDASAHSTRDVAYFGVPVDFDPNGVANQMRVHGPSGIVEASVF